ncbi:unnamed protein product, partial [Prorocentrum cordatum]
SSGSCVRWHGKPRAVTCAIKRGAGATRHIMEEEEEEEKNTEDEEEEEEEEEEAFTRKLTRATCAPASAQSAPFSSVALVAAWRLHTAHRTAPIDDRLCWEDSVRLRLQPHPSFGCASHLQGTRESRNRWARPPSAGRRAASRRVEKAITKNPAPSAATTKSARAAAPRRGWAAKTGSHRGRGLRGCAEGPRAPQRSGQLSRAAPTHRASLDPLRAPLRRGTARWEEYVPLYCGQFPTAAYMRSTGCWNREQSHCSRRDAAPASRTAMLTLPNDNSRIARAAPGWLRHGAEVGRGRVNDFRRGGGGGEGRRSIDLRSRGHGAPRFRVASRRGHGGPNPPLPRLALLGFGGGGRGCLETRSVVRVASPWVEGT